jgi:hypothetical protein
MEAETIHKIINPSKFMTPGKPTPNGSALILFKSLTKTYTFEFKEGWAY